MNLSGEDSLRLNVLIANAEAIRVDDSAMAVFGLQGERELKVQLNPTCNPERYLVYVRELLSSVVLDSPGGYPVFLRRWTRMGQIQGEQLHRLLRLGEPEAITAVVCSPGLTDELARRAWWCAPSADHARRMLENGSVVHGSMGPVLAEYLIDYLPFETEHRDIMESVRLVLQPGLISIERRRRLWDAGRNKKSYRVGFLWAEPDALPDRVEAHNALSLYADTLENLAKEGNRTAGLLSKLLDPMGQTFISVTVDALRRPPDQEVVTALLDAVGAYFSPARLEASSYDHVDAIQERVSAVMGAADSSACRLVEALPQLRREIEAMLFLAWVDDSLVTPIFSRSDAVGSVMRAKIAPVVEPIFTRLALLRGDTGAVSL